MRQAIGKYSEKVLQSNHDKAVEYVNSTLGVISTHFPSKEEMNRNF